MIRFSVDARDGMQRNGSACDTSCCCEEANAVPGEINKWWINYSRWLHGIGGRGLVNPVQFQFERLTIDPPPPFPTNLPPVSIDYFFNTPYQTALNGDVSVSASDPEAAPLTFATVPGQGVSHGTLIFNPNGTFTYTPMNGWTGYDQFAYTVSDGVNAPVRYVVTIGTNPQSGPALPPIPVIPIPALQVPQNRVHITPTYIEFPLVVAQDAIIGDIYRMRVVATAMDCNGQTYRHHSCYDIRIVKC